MEDLNELYQLLQRADAAGDNESVDQLIPYIKQVEAEQASQATEEQPIDVTQPQPDLTKPPEVKPIIQPPKEPSNIVRRVTGDTALGLGQGVIEGAKAFIGLADIPTMGYAGKAHDYLAKKIYGGTLSDAEKYLQSLKTPEQQIAEQKVEQAKGFMPTVKELAKNPSALLNVLEQSVPSMMGGVGIASKVQKGAKLLETNAPRIAKYLEVGAPAIGEMAISGGQTAESVREQMPEGTLTPAQSGIAAASGIATGVLSVLGSKVARILGVDNLETYLLKKVTGKAAEAEKRNALAVAVKTAVNESVVEELPQSMQEQIAQNIMLGQPWDQGVAEAGATGLLTGAAMSGPIVGIGQVMTNRDLDRRAKMTPEDFATEGQRPSRDTLKRQFKKSAEEKANEINKAKVADINLSTITQTGAEADQGKLFNVVGGPSVEVGKPIIVGPLDDNTLTSWGIKKNSNAFKALKGVDASTPEGRDLVDKTLEAYTGKLNEDAINTFTSTLDQQKEEAPDARIDLGTTRISDAVLGGQTYGTPGGTQGRYGPTTDISGGPFGIDQTREGAGNAPLKEPKTLPTGERLLSIQELLNDPNPQQRRAARRKFIDMFETDQANELIKEEAKVEREERAKLAKLKKTQYPIVDQSTNLANILSTLKDKPNYLIEDLRNPDVPDAERQELNQHARDYLLTESLRNKYKTRMTAEEVAALEKEGETVTRKEKPLSEDEFKDLQDEYLARQKQDQDIFYNIASPLDANEWSKGAALIDENGAPIKLYHGTTTEVNTLKSSKDGALGAGIYLTPDPEFAGRYAEGEGGNVLPVYTNIKNPLVINSEMGKGDPMIQALIQLGVAEDKAADIVEKAYETKGYISKEVQSRAQKQGYDGIVQYKDGKLSEVVAFNAAQVKSAFSDLKTETDKTTSVPQPEVVTSTGKAKTLGQALNIIDTEHADKITEPEKILIKKLKTIPNLINTKYQTATLNKYKNTSIGGTFNSLLNKVTIDKVFGNVKAVLHEAVHSATVAALRKAVYTTHHVNKQLKKAGMQPHEYTVSEHVGRTEAGKKMVKIYNAAKKVWMESDKPRPYGMKDIFEFTSEAFSNPDFQKFLADIPSIFEPTEEVKVPSLWTDFFDAVKKLLNLGDISNTLLNDVIAVAPELMEGPKTSIFDRIKSPFEGEDFVYEQRATKKELDEDLEKSGTKGKIEKGFPTLKERFMEAPIKTTDELMADFRKSFFSFDAAINNKMIIAAKKMGLSQKEIADMIYASRISQAVKADQLADMWMVHGGISYDSASFSFIIKDLANSMSTIREDLKALAKKYGVSEYEMYQYGNAAFVSARSKELMAHNAALYNRIVNLYAAGKKADADKAADNYKLVHQTPAEIKRGLKFFTTIPELKKIAKTWNINRERILDLAVDQGLYTREKADDLLDVIHYVPFFRDKQIEARKAVNLNKRGLLDAAVDKHLKGSYQPVHNVFVNMELWSKYIFKKSINNRIAQEKIKYYSQLLPDDIKVLRGNRTATGNVVSVWQDGKVVKYEFQGYDGESMVDGFTGLEPVTMLPGAAFFRPFNTFLRAQIVLEPLFNVAQIPMDMFNAMFSSGVNVSLAIPLQVAKEIILTPLGLSSARKYLSARAATGKHDFSSEYEVIDINAMKEVKEVTKMGKLLEYAAEPFKATLKGLRFFGMASDNVIRQAVFSQIMLETGNVARATQAAEEIINFRRTGSSAVVNIARQNAIFVNANLQSMNIAYGTLLLSDITPDSKLVQARRLLLNGAQVIMAILAITAMNADDDDYKKIDPKDRDNAIVLPGTGGFKLPLRGDILTLMFKILPEHLYNRYIAESEDSEKMKLALSRAFKKAITFPSPFPNALTSIVEQSLNFDFVTGRPLVGRGQESLAPELQFSNKYTSQFAKWVAEGSKEIGAEVSPASVQHFMNRWLASTSLLVGMFTNSLIAQIRKDILPDLTTKQTLLQIPNMGKFVSKDENTRNINDLYELNDLVNSVVETANKYDKLGDHAKFREFLEKDHNQQLYNLKKELATISRDLGNLREWENRVYYSKDTGRWTPQTKRQELDRIEAARQRILGHEQGVKEAIDRRIQNLRRQGGL